MISRYKEFLDFIDAKLEKMFESQKAFISCQKGCAYCCKEGEYPLSELEFLTLMFYYNELEDSIRDKINENIVNLLKSERTKMYQCPFLIDNQCAVYPMRAIICRTFGLISYDEKGKKRIPFCVEIGLNYADVFDKDNKKIINLAKDGSEPLAFNIDRKFLRSKEFEKQFNIFFGEDKSLIEWLESMDFV